MRRNLPAEVDLAKVVDVCFFGEFIVLLFEVRHVVTLDRVGSSSHHELPQDGTLFRSRVREDDGPRDDTTPSQSQSQAKTEPSSQPGSSQSATARLQGHRAIMRSLSAIREAHRGLIELDPVFFFIFIVSSLLPLEARAQEALHPRLHPMHDRDRWCKFSRCCLATALTESSVVSDSQRVSRPSSSAPVPESSIDSVMQVLPDRTREQVIESVCPVCE